MKAWLLRGRVPLDESVLSVVVAKTTIMIGQGLFLLVGIVITWLAAPSDSRLLGWMLWLLAVEVLAIVGFLLAQIQGGFGWVPRVLGRIGLGRSRHRETVARLDRGLAWFYRKEPRRLVLSIGFQVEETLRYHTSLSSREARERALALLEHVKIPSAARRFPSASDSRYRVAARRSCAACRARLARPRSCCCTAGWPAAASTGSVCSSRWAIFAVIRPGPAEEARRAVTAAEPD